jgi:type VI secretion system protein VasJ
VSRLNGIENLAFADETPFADPETKAWLADLAKPGEGGGGASAAAADSEEAMVEEEFDRARQTAKEKDLPTAVEMIQEKLLAGGSSKSRLLWRMALARLLVLSKKNVPAKPHIEAIMAEIEKFRLEEWDPALALEGYKVVLSALRMNKDPEAVQKTRQVLDSIARISPGEALRLEG